MRPIKLLFTGVGRRIELIQAFREAALKINVPLKIYGADMTGTAPALLYCDYVRKVCGMREPNYIRELAEICRQDEIDLLIPTIDTDLLVLSRNAFAFENTRVLISDADKIEICRDKNLTADFFEACGCYAPKTVNDWRHYNSGFPCFIKPKDGSSSVDAYKVETVEELEAHAQHISEYIVQSFIDGTEYTVDVFCDFEGKPVYITPRIRLQVRAGEVLKTQIVMDQRIIEESTRIISKFKPVGPMTIQLIREKTSDKDYFIEINPRFGGGAPLSMKAGARSAETILKLLMHESIVCDHVISDGAIYSRFDQSVCIDTGITKQSVRGVIFDLDDTLYDEKQYVRSGFSAVSKFLGRADAEKRLWELFLMKKPAIDQYLFEIGASDRKSECLEIYREHVPQITLIDGVPQMIDALMRRGIKIGIITDGRPSAQRNKLRALGLGNMVDDAIVTDELGGEQFRKPCDISFRIMQRRWRIPFEQIVYVGDNIDKDFQAPSQLGMQCILVNNGNGLYSGNKNGIPVTDLLNHID